MSAASLHPDKTTYLPPDNPRPRRAVKIILMDQRVLAGIGNILATDALWIARLDPRSPGVALLPSDAPEIAKGLHRAIARELADPGDSFFI